MRVRKLTQTLVALIVFYAAYEIVPPYLRAYVFRDDITQIAREATYEESRSDGGVARLPMEERVRDQVTLRAMDLGIALPPDGLHVMRDDQKVVIAADYTVHANMWVRQFDLKFQVTSQSK